MSWDEVFASLTDEILKICKRLNMLEVSRMSGREDKETLISNLNNAMNAVVYVMSDYIDRNEVDYIINLIERDIDAD